MVIIMDVLVIMKIAITTIRKVYTLYAKGKNSLRVICFVSLNNRFSLYSELETTCNAKILKGNGEW